MVPYGQRGWRPGGLADGGWIVRHDDPPYGIETVVDDHYYALTHIAFAIVERRSVGSGGF